MEGVRIEETMLSDMCPDIESAFCFPHKYRTINGECNNVKNPTWGITGAAYLRILQPTYQDGEMQSWLLSVMCAQRDLLQCTLAAVRNERGALPTGGCAEWLGMSWPPALTLATTHRTLPTVTQQDARKNSNFS